MSRSLVKLVDSAILPAAVMICAKVIGLIIINYVMQLDWGISTPADSFFSIRVTYPTEEDKVAANSYSNLSMYLFVLIGFSINLLRALFFHETHISPKMIAKLATSNLLGLVKNSFDVFHEASIWLLFLWISAVFILVNTVQGINERWIALFTIVLTMILTVIYLRDVNRELKENVKVKREE